MKTQKNILEDNKITDNREINVLAKKICNEVFKKNTKKILGDVYEKKGVKKNINELKKILKKEGYEVPEKDEDFYKNTILPLRKKFIS